MSQRIFRFVILVTVFITHIMAFIQFKTMPQKLPFEWEGQILFLLIVSVFLSVLLLISKCKPIYVWLIFFIRYIIFLVIGLPMGSYLGIEQTLLTPLIIEALEFSNLITGIFFSLMIIGLTIAMQYIPIFAWGRYLQIPHPPDIWAFGVNAVIITIVISIFQYQRKNQVPSMEIDRLFHESTLQLSQVNMQLQEYAVTVEQKSIINERKRLARDLHDILAYTLTNLIMMIEEAKDLAVRDGKALLEHLDHVCGQTKEGLAELRRTIQALRPVNLTATSGLAAIQQLVATFNKATQIEINLELGNVPLNFGEEADMVAYRLVQEGITNALRHGRATGIMISFSLINNGVSIHIKDNGVGALNPQEGYGLLGMRERIQQLGGKLEVSSRVGEGFRLLAWIPLDKGGLHEQNQSTVGR